MPQTFINKSNIPDETLNRDEILFEQVHIEITNHCGYKCYFCPREQLVRDRGFISMEDIETVMKRVDDAVGTFAGPIHLANYGEAMLDRKLPQKIRLLTTHWPNSHPLFVTTLGVKWDRSQLLELVEAGLKEIRVSFYSHTKDQYEKVTGVDGMNTAKKNLKELVDIANERPGSLRILVKTGLQGAEEEMVTDEKGNFLQWLTDIGVDHTEETPLHNYGKSRVYAKPDKEICSFVDAYRSRILQVTWDLKVIPCCFDFNATMKIGDLRIQGIREIYDSEPYRKLVYALANQDYKELPICRLCSKKR